VAQAGQIRADAYTEIVVRIRWAMALLGTALFAQQPPAPPKPPPAQQQEPPEEDESVKPKEYTLNPIEAQKNVVAGDYYFKKGKIQAARSRYTEATRWDPGSAEAFLKLAQADEKLHDRKGAREAYAKYLELSPDAKNASEIRKKLSKLSN
jgi:predicted Zn-dependent protease